MSDNSMFVSEQEPYLYSSNSSEQPARSRQVSIFGSILIVLLAVVVGVLLWNQLKSPPKYAYKVIGVQAQFNKPGATNTSSQPSNPALNPTSVNLSDEELNLLGREGWELVGTFLEEETTHPNFGNSDYVTGIQPNIRPQRAVMIFKRLL